jgi:hypothetical protein
MMIRFVLEGYIEFSIDSLLNLQQVNTQIFK